MTRTLQSLLASALILMAGCSRREHLCANWELSRPFSLPGSGSSQLQLKRTDHSGVVAELVFQPRCFSKDCVLYGSSLRGPAMYAACGGHRPVQLNVDAMDIDNWTFGADGYSKGGEAFLIGKSINRKRRIFRYSDLETAEAGQALGASTSVVQIVEPREETVPVDARSSEGQTLLFDSLADKREDIALTLIANGVQLDGHDSFDRGAVVLAAAEHLSRVVAVLIDAGAPATELYPGGFDALTLSTEFDDVPTFDVLYARRERLHFDTKKALRLASGLPEEAMTRLRQWDAEEERYQAARKH